MKRIITISLCIILMLTCLFGCANNQASKEKIIRVFERNQNEFECVVEFLSTYDYSEHEKYIDSNDAIFGNFGISDFKYGKKKMIIEGGTPWALSIYYEEVEIPDEIKKTVSKIFFSRGFAYIRQINARDENQVFLFRFDDTKTDYDYPHGVVYSENGSTPKKLFSDRDVIEIKQINKNWFYFKAASFAEAE